MSPERRHEQGRGLRRARLTAAFLLSVLPVLVGGTRLHAQSSLQPPASFLEPSTYSSSPSDKLLTTWLTSGDPRVEAWAAHFILVENRASMLAELKAAILRAEAESSAPHPLHPGDWYRAMPALVDPVVAMNATLEPAATEALPPVVEDARALLLMRLEWADAAPIWMRLYQPGRQEGGRSTRVAAEILARRPQPGFSATLLHSVRVRVQITVTEADGSLFGVGGGFASCCGAGLRGTTAVWPEFGSYVLLTPRQKRNGRTSDVPLPADARLVLAGPDPIYTRRVVSTEPVYGRTCNDTFLLNDAMRSHLLGTMLGGEPMAPLPETFERVSIPYTGSEAYYKAIADHVAGLQATFAGIASRLTAQGFMTEKERQAAELRIELDLYDGRKKPAADLPAVIFREPVVWLTDHPMWID